MSRVLVGRIRECIGFSGVVVAGLCLHAFGEPGVVPECIIHEPGRYITTEIVPGEPLPPVCSGMTTDTDVTGADPGSGTGVRRVESQNPEGFAEALGRWCAFRTFRADSGA